MTSSNIIITALNTTIDPVYKAPSVLICGKKIIITN
jgi:hypothetical protein